MMKIFKYLFLYTISISLLLLSISCRQPVIPDEEDLSEYGWLLYEDGKYEDAREWFKDGMKKDTSYADSYNGLGWCFGKLRQPDSALYYFSKGIQKEFDPFKTPFLDLDLYAGIIFSYNGLGEDELVREFAGYFFGNQNLAENNPWAFLHEPKIDYLDVRIVQSLAEYNTGFFQASLETLEQIYRDLGDPTGLKMDITTVKGRAELASEIVLLQQSLKN